MIQNLLPHIDVVGDDTIQQIMGQQDQVLLRAPRAEALENWIPDVGQAYQPYRCLHGVYRSPEMSTAGIPGVLRHRWFEAQDRLDVRGSHFVGLVIYASVGDAAGYQILSGSEELGELRPRRHDNRRHLIVTEHPLDILDGQIPFTVRTNGPGRCYLESVLLMSERPVASSFEPTIEHLTAVPGGMALGNDTAATAEIHFLTAEAARATVTLLSDAGAGAEPVVRRLDALYPIHTAAFTGLESGKRYTAHVHAETDEGETAEASVDFVTGDTAAVSGDGGTRAPVEVPISILASPGDRIQMPITFGVPVEAGALHGTVGASLRVGNEDGEVQARVHSRWPDGSARWVLIDATCPPADGVSSTAAVSLRSAGRPASTETGLRSEVSEERIVVTGPLLRATVSRGGPLPLALEERHDGSWRPLFTEGGGIHGRLGNGLELHGAPPEDLSVEEQGPQRTVVRYDTPILDTEGIEHLRCRVRLHLYARHRFVRLVHRTTVVSPVLGAAIGGSDAAGPTHSAVVGESGEATSLLWLEDLQLDLPFLGATSVSLTGGVETAIPEGGWRVLHEHEQTHTVTAAGDAQRRQGRTRGHVVVSREVGGGAALQPRLALGLRHFWQTYPKGLSIDSNGLSVELFPKLGGGPLPQQEEEGHRLYFWYDPERAQYKLKVGSAFTSELLVGVPDEAAPPTELDAWFTWLEQPPRARPELNYLNRTGALLAIGAKQDSVDPAYEEALDRAAGDRVSEADQKRLYGYMNFGDGYAGDAQTGGTWDNNEYDAPFCYYVEFLRGGDPLWFELAEQAARHLADIDTCHHSPRQADVGGQYMHIPGHMGGFHPPFFRFKMAGSTQVPSHMWVEGPVLHYLLTGDEAMRDTLTNAGEWLTHGLLHSDIKNSRESGWRLIHLCGLLRMKEDHRIRNAARVLVEKVLQKQLPTGGWERPLTASHCQCPVPLHYGEAGFMIGILMAGLRRYYAIDDDARVAEAIVGGARWLVENTYDPKVGLFRYTNCHTRSPEAHPAQVLQIIEGLVEACAITPDPQLRSIIEHNLPAISATDATCAQIRYVPLVFHSLAELRAREASNGVD